jgi:hypothetical protein
MLVFFEEFNGAPMTGSTLRFDKQRAEVGVGSKSFIENIKAKLGIRAKGCTVAGSRDSY